MDTNIATMFYDVENYEVLRLFEKESEKISEELAAVSNKPMRAIHESTWAGERPDYLTNPIDKETAWKTYTFRFFGIDHIPNMESCPQIASLLKDQPAIVTAEFSMLEPQTHILPHRGYTNQILRSHLGLTIPSGDTAIRVGAETKRWEQGKILVFDDSMEHEAWNKTDERRIVLMLDFEPDFDPHKAMEICEYIFKTTNDSHILQIAPRENWLEWLHDGNFPIEWE